MNVLPRVIVYASHPIQYQVPWFRALHQSGAVDLRVVFAHLPTPQQQGQGFGVAFKWDTDLLDGYAWSVATLRPLLRAKSGFFEHVALNPYAEMREHQADVALITGWHSVALVQWLNAAQSDSIPVIMRGESNLMRPRRNVIKLWHKYLLQKCNAFLTIGTANRRFYEAYGVSARHMRDAPYFVDNAHFTRAAGLALPERLALRERWGIQSNAVCFCFAGKLESKKRLLVLLDALAQAVRLTDRKLHLLVVGTGEQMEAARHLVETQQLPVTFAGFLNQGEIPLAYLAADCLVLPSDAGETWGLVVNEAMACSRPAIVSDHVGCRLDLVEEGATGFVVPLDNVDALAGALCTAASADLAQLGRFAFERVTRLCSVERATAATLESIQALAVRMSK